MAKFQPSQRVAVQENWGLQLLMFPTTGSNGSNSWWFEWCKPYIYIYILLHMSNMCSVVVWWSMPPTMRGNLPDGQLEGQQSASGPTTHVTLQILEWEKIHQVSIWLFHVTSMFRPHKCSLSGADLESSKFNMLRSKCGCDLGSAELELSTRWNFLSLLGQGAAKCEV